MNATIAYYTYDGTRYTEDANGNIPGLKWTDENGNNYFCVVKYWQTQFGNNVSVFNYSTYVNPVGTDICLPNRDTEVYIQNSNFIEMATGHLVREQETLDEILENRELKEEYASQYMKQFDYFVMLIGKNIPNQVFALYPIFLNDIAYRENLDLPA